MKALIVLVLLGVVAYFAVTFFSDVGNGRVAGPMSPPFSVTYRDSYIGHGIVIDIANHSEKILYGVRLNISNKDGHHTSLNVTNVLKPGEDKEIGWLELDNWKLEVGEDITIYADGYPAPFFTSCSGHQN